MPPSKPIATSTSGSSSELLDRLDASPSPWVVTRTRRLARDLTLRVAETRAARGLSVADTPPIRKLDDWLEELARETLVRELAARSDEDFAGRVLLSRAAELLLWEKVIAASPGDLPRELLDTAALAATAADAWRRICLWGEPAWPPAASEDVEAFRGWLPSFRAHLVSGGFVTAAEAPALVAAAIGEGLLEDLQPAEVVVLGFERSDPALERLLDALRSRGCKVSEQTQPQSDAPPPALQVLRAGTRTAEVRGVAARIRARLREDPSLRVAVLAPDLSSYAKLIERVFEEELDPEGVAEIGEGSVRRFDFAEAPALADYPLVACALDVLGLDAGSLAFSQVSRVLLSAHPRTGDDDERDRALRGALEARLRRSRAARLRLAGAYGSVAGEAAAAGLGRLAAGLEELADRIGKLARRSEKTRDDRRSPGWWRDEWLGRLAVVGWPGAIRGDAEGLVFRRWQDALQEFVGLESVEPAMSATQALSRLASICASTPVQPASQGFSVKVMNTLDAAGLEFDLVCVIGMTATAFPPPPRPNPLLPVRWQREQRGMPRASVEAERELAAAVWARLLASTTELVVTWPAVGQSDEENTASAFIADLPLAELTAGECEPWWLASARADASREPRPPEDPAQTLVRNGGSSILTQQASCPFRAFAATRLGAEPLAEVRPQPDAARRGTLVHSALAHAYSAIPSSSDLAGLSDGNVAEVARDAARAAIEGDRSFFEAAPDLADGALQWLQELVAAWMAHERDDRRDAWTVDSMEETLTVEFPPGAENPLVIRFRPDRIDRVGDGVVLIDFKTTGSAKRPGLWAGERPAEPQMPLYLALLEAEGRRVDALAFANLSARDSCSLSGLAATEIAPDCKPPSTRQKKFPPSYAEAVAAMRGSVEALARGYLGGDVHVDPKSARDCKYCGSQALCRVVESGPLADEELEEGDE